MRGEGGGTKNASLLAQQGRLLSPSLNLLKKKGKEKESCMPAKKRKENGKG